MKIGIISDIHSNIIALKACITYMESVSCDEYLFLGDYISDTPYTRETMDYVYDFSFFDSLPITYQYKKQAVHLLPFVMALRRVPVKDYLLRGKILKTG